MMYEDGNEIPVPDMTVLRNLHSVVSCGTAETVSARFGDVGPLDPSVNEEPIDNDPTINALLTACDL